MIVKTSFSFTGAGAGPSAPLSPAAYIALQATPNPDVPISLGTGAGRSLGAAAAGGNAGASVAGLGTTGAPTMGPPGLLALPRDDSFAMRSGQLVHLPLPTRAATTAGFDVDVPSAWLLLLAATGFALQRFAVDRR